MKPDILIFLIKEQEEQKGNWKAFDGTHEFGDLNLSQRQDLGRPSWTFAVWVGQCERNSRIMGITKTGGLGAASVPTWLLPTTLSMPTIWA